MFSTGTTIVKGTENDDSIDVTVEIYIELHAPPEHIVNGIDREENTFKRTCFINEGTEGWSLSIKLRNE